MASINLNILTQVKKSIANVKGFQATVNKQLGQIQKRVGLLNLSFASFLGNLQARAVASAFNAVRSTISGVTGGFFELSEAVAEVNSILPDTAALTEENRRQFIRFSTTFGATPGAQAKAFYQIVSAGITDTSKAIKLLTVSNKAGVAGLTDIGVAIDGITSVLAVYGQRGLDATDISDIFFAAVREGKTTFDQLSRSIGRVSSIAGTVGVSFDEVAGTLAFLTKVGISTEEAVTGIRAVLSSIIKPAEQAKKAAKDLGIDFSVAGLRAKGFGGFLAEIAKVTKGSAEELVKLFPNIRALGAVAAISGGDLDDFRRILDATANSAGATEAAFKKISDSAAFQFKALTRTIQNLPAIFLTGADPEFAELFKTLRITIQDLTPVFADLIILFATFGQTAIRTLEALRPSKIKADVNSFFDFIEQRVKRGGKIIAETDAEINKINEDFKAFSKTANTKAGDALVKSFDAIIRVATKLRMTASQTFKDIGQDAEKATRDLAGLNGEASKLAANLSKASDAALQFASRFGAEDAAAELLRRRLQVIQEAQVQNLITLEQGLTARETLELEFEQKRIEKLISDEQLRLGVQKQGAEERLVAEQGVLQRRLDNETLSNAQRLVAQRRFDQSALKLQTIRQKKFEQNQRAFLGTASTLANNESQVLKAIGKSAALVNIGIKTSEAAVSSFAFGSAIGGPILGAIFQGIAIAAGAAQAAKVASLQTGLTSVPPGFPNDTFRANLSSGERVTTSRQNQDLTEFLDRENEKANGTDQAIVAGLALIARMLGNLENTIIVRIGNKEVLRAVRDGRRAGGTLAV